MHELLLELKNNPVLFLFTITILAFMVGSFLNVVIYRVPKSLFLAWQQECNEFLTQTKLNIEELPNNYNIAWPGSQCPKCKHSLPAKDNIPVLSYLFLGGKCRFCQVKISLRYPLVEILTASLSIIVALNFGYSLECIFALLITWTLIAQTFIDFDHMLIPDSITLPMLWLGLLVSTTNVPISSAQAILGASFGYLSLWMVYQLFKLCTHKDGMGYGDFKLLAMLGAWLGWQMLPLIIIISSLLGTVVGLSMILTQGKSKNTLFPFGPYLAIAGWIALNWGRHINQYYLSHVL